MTKLDTVTKSVVREPILSAMMLEPNWKTISQFCVTKRRGDATTFVLEKIFKTLQRVTHGLDPAVSVGCLWSEVAKNIFDGIATKDLNETLILAATALIERDPAYSKVASRLLLQKIYKEVCQTSLRAATIAQHYYQAFLRGIEDGISDQIFDPRLSEFDLKLLATALDCKRDDMFEYIGLQILADRYLLKQASKWFELPQAFWMRVAMGLALNEPDRNARAIEFYELLSSLRFVSSTPTLLHAGLVQPQLSSCYLLTVNDDLTHIFKSFSDIAQLSKWSGGVASDWTNIRATGAMINTIKVESQGLIPFLKIANDVTAAINRSGKRRSATVAYLETWHLDIEDFLDLRRNTGDERRRAHDMNFANWIPDLFMQRVQVDGEWTLFSPENVSDLHHLYGQQFAERYLWYEEQARAGHIKKHKIILARDLWRKMITRLFETGFPWMVFKDAANLRSPQDHVGVVYSSNLCTEITLNTSPAETAVCNLGSVNLARHIINGELDENLFIDTISKAMRMLDNVIDINFYPTIEAKNSNERHRPVGLGLMGFQDALFQLDLAMDDPVVLDFTDRITEKFSYYAILASSQLARERGIYSSYSGSKWDRGLLPVDTLDLLEHERGQKVTVARDAHLDWSVVRNHIKKYGMRNSNTMAIAPTATIANIAGCYPCIEPLYTNLYVKANMAGEFTVVNSYLIDDLKQQNLWNQDMLEQIKYYDGSIQAISDIPEQIKAKYKGAFELDPIWLIRLTAMRSKWVDQSISHNVFVKSISGQQLSEIYMTAWQSGLKSTYYLRSLGASQIEKSTLDAKKFGYTQKRAYNSAVTIATAVVDSATTSAKLPVNMACQMEPDCEVCQ